ncbi:cupin domain-containing protein [Limnoraphis robusta]|uniref:Cupin n=1 Tax=Limnoraphis robusta CS-951 TaxID=1637645 RepID=A0A0F5YHZ3_9CYAN|nr:cupin domain-containing protein [Limnoraphis robusta]KKD38262.1 cupin [Limnoraphis robusta CS-951]
MQTFATLLAPHSGESFLQNYWLKQAVIIPASHPHKFSHLFSWQDLNTLLNFHHLIYPEIRLAKGGQTLPENAGDDLIKQCQEGATLIVDCLHTRLPAIAEFSANLRKELGHRTQVNAYCSFPGHQGFACHYDAHEVFILQISGHKHWRVFSSTFEFPLSKHRSSLFDPPTTEPYVDQVLKPGDLLYIPRGHWHYAIAVDQPSLHLTLGVDCQTGIDFAEWLTEELQQNPLWRKSLPLLTSTHRQACHQQLRDLFKEWVQQLQTDELIDRYLDEQFMQGQPSTQFGFPAQVGFHLFPEGQQTHFYRPPQPVKITNLSEDRIEICTANKRITLKGISREVLERLFQSTKFSGIDLCNWLPEFDWEADICPMITELIKSGVLLVDPPKL